MIVCLRRKEVVGGKADNDLRCLFSCSIAKKGEELSPLNDSFSVYCPGTNTVPFFHAKFYMTYKIR